MQTFRGFADRGQRAVVPPEEDPNAVKGTTDPAIIKKQEENDAEDSLRKMAGQVNKAFGGDKDFSQTGGGSVRDMGREIANNIGGPLGNVYNKVTDKVEQAADAVSGAAKGAVNKAAEAVGVDATTVGGGKFVKTDQDSGARVPTNLGTGAPPGGDEKGSIGESGAKYRQQITDHNQGGKL
eukprot:jgi/Chrzof1/3409/Cz12g24080.t1